MSDKALAQTKDVKLPPDLSIQQQNDVSSNAISTRFLAEVSDALRPNDPTAVFSDAGAHEDIALLQGDPLKKQVLNQVVTDMSNTDLMDKLGLTGTVNRDRNGDISSLSFASADGIAAYQKTVLSMEARGDTPTAVNARLKAGDDSQDGAYTGRVTYDTSDKPAPTPSR